MFSNSTNKTLIILLLLTLGTNVLILKDDLAKYALALSPNYSKTTTPPGNQLSTIEWNNLPNDFVAKSGDTMTGPLNLPGAPTQDLQAATKAYVDGNANSIKDIANLTGPSMKMVCGRTPSIAYSGTPTNWVDWGIGNVAYNINLASAGFTATPYYFVSLGGTGYHLETTGGSSVYNPTNTGFRAEVHYIGVLPFDASVAKTPTWDWHIMWCAVGR